MKWLQMKELSRHIIILAIAITMEDIRKQTTEKLLNTSHWVRL